MNFIFISPHFPDSSKLFCQSLKNNGVNVLGIGDCYYEDFSDELKQSLTDYYRVDSLENYEEVLRGCAYFIYRYGRIDKIESLNEYWLKNDALLRKDFNISGMHPEYMDKIRRKSGMKEFYKKAGVPFARYITVNDMGDYVAAKEFGEKYGYPILAKPDIGVGATSTFKIESQGELEDFLSGKDAGPFIIEEFVRGNIITFDGLTDSGSNILYAANHFLPVSLLDMVSNDTDVIYHSEKVSQKLMDVGQRTLKAFNAKSQFFHFEYFLLDEDDRRFGQKGDIVALEVNMRPGGAYIPDMINYAADIDIYQLWADMICYDKIPELVMADYYSGYVGRKYKKMYRHSHDDIVEKYGDKIVLVKDVEGIFTRAMGKIAYIFRSEELSEIEEITEYITR